MAGCTLFNTIWTLSIYVLVTELTLIHGLPQIEDYILEELLRNTHSNPEIKRFSPSSLTLNPGRRWNDYTDFAKRFNAGTFSFNRGKKLNPASFSFNRGKKFDTQGVNDLDALESYYPYEEMDKRRPPSGFTGMRGKRSDYNDGELTVNKRRPPVGYVVVRGKRMPPTGFTGLRGKRIPPTGFSSLRGRKRSPPTGFTGLRGKKSKPPTGFSSLRGRKRGPPEGFLGLRGKKDLLDVNYRDKKVPPHGFSGLRGKKNSMDHIYEENDPLFAGDVIDDGSKSDTYSPAISDLEHYMQEFNFIHQLRKTPPDSMMT